MKVDSAAAAQIQQTTASHKASSAKAEKASAAAQTAHDNATSVPKNTARGSHVNKVA